MLQVRIIGLTAKIQRTHQTLIVGGALKTPYGANALRRKKAQGITHVTKCQGDPPPTHQRPIQSEANDVACT